MTYQMCGLTSVSEFLEDRIVYRNLRPADPRLPAFAELRNDLGLPMGSLRDQPAPPRKAEPAYGLVVAELLRRARSLDLPGVALRRLIYVGDTHMNDGMAFRNLCAAGAWPGWAFIGKDDLCHAPGTSVEGPVYLANRWSALPQFLRFIEGQGFGLDEGTAMVIDLDKTAIGARGRNDGVIDGARVEAVQQTVSHLLGPRADASPCPLPFATGFHSEAERDGQAFLRAYDELKQPAYHPFTSDNQDYLTYVCLMLGAGLFELDHVILQIRSGTMQRFGDFIAQVQARRSELAETGLTTVHDTVWHNFVAGDPTPFKAFRAQEYLCTTAYFGDLPGALVEEVLSRRIVVTQEVRLAAAALRGRGVLVFGVSDKPDEASIPTPAQSQAGMQPLHRLTTLSVGEG